MVLSVPLLGAGMANFFAELKRRHIYRRWAPLTSSRRGR